MADFFIAQAGAVGEVEEESSVIRDGCVFAEQVLQLGVGGYLGKFFPLYEFRNGIGAGIMALLCNVLSVPNFAPQMAEIVAYVEQLNALATSNVEPALGGLTPEGESVLDTARRMLREVEAHRGPLKVPAYPHLGMSRERLIAEVLSQPNDVDERTLAVEARFALIHRRQHGDVSARELAGERGELVPVRRATQRAARRPGAEPRDSRGRAGRATARRRAPR